LKIFLRRFVVHQHQHAPRWYAIVQTRLNKMRQCRCLPCPGHSDHTCMPLLMGNDGLLLLRQLRSSVVSVQRIRQKREGSESVKTAWYGARLGDAIQASTYVYKGYKKRPET